MGQGSTNFSKALYRGNKTKMLRFWPNWCQIVPFDAVSHKQIFFHICDVIVRSTTSILRGQSSDMYIGIMTNLWPLKSSRRLHRRYGKIFCYYLQHQQEQFDTFLFCYPCKRAFEKFVDPWPLLTYISRTKHLTNMILWTFLFLMISGTIWYATWHNSDILIFLYP